MALSDAGKDTLAEADLFPQLAQVGYDSNLDYLSRIIVTSLGFTDGGFSSKSLLETWSASESCTRNLRVYCQTILRAMVRSQVGDTSVWGMDVIVTVLQFDDLNTKTLVHALEEMTLDRSILRSLVHKAPNLINIPHSNQLLLRFLADVQGLQTLKREPWFDREVTQWRKGGSKFVKYGRRIEKSLSLALSSTDDHLFEGVTPIPVTAKSFLSNSTQNPSTMMSKGRGVSPDGGVDLG